MSHAVALWSVLSPVLIVLAAIIFIVLERRFPYTRGQRLLRDLIWTDLLGYALIQSYLLGLVIARIIAWLDTQTGLSRLHLVSGWPVALQVAFFVITHDLYIYSFHRLQHRSPLLWRIHEAHHATADVDWLSGSRSHALEILVNQTIEFAPLALLGAAPEVAIIKLTIDAIWGMYIHANIDVRSGRLQWLVNGPEMHRWHHALEIRDGVNFATKFAFWDWLLGTAYRPAHKPRAYGLDDVVFPRGFLAQQLFAFLPRKGMPAEADLTFCLRARNAILAAGVWIGRLLLVLGAAVPYRLTRSRRRLPPPSERRPAPLVGVGGARPRVLLVGGTINHTTQVHQIARELGELERSYTWYYGDGALEVFRKLGWLNSTALGDKLRARCLAYLQREKLPLDLDGARGGYDLAITCSDLAMPTNLRAGRIVLVQEGMTDPEDSIFRLVRALGLPPWLTTTSSATGLSHGYDRFCVASEGYRALFERKGVHPDRLVVTGIPNFDNCERYRHNDFPHRGFVLVCSSDIRETARWEDRPAFIADVVRIAAGRQIVWKLHPNENAARARAEIARVAPAALVYDAGSAEEMIANCDVLVTQYSSTAYVGLALGKQVHSYFDVEELRRLCPIQNGSTSARRIADVCRQLLGLPVPVRLADADAGGSGADRLLPEDDVAVLAGHERHAAILRDHDG